MKKALILFIGLPLTGFAAIAALASYGNQIKQTCVPGNADYEAGTGICSARNAANTIAQAKRDADRKQAEQEEATRFLTVQERATFANRQNIARECEQTYIRPFLKDPNSFRYLGHNYVMQGDRKVDVHVSYTATNGFGGRVRGSQTCTFTF